MLPSWQIIHEHAKDAQRVTESKHFTLVFTASRKQQPWWRFACSHAERDPMVVVSDDSSWAPKIRWPSSWDPLTREFNNQNGIWLAGINKSTNKTSPDPSWWRGVLMAYWGATKQHTSFWSNNEQVANICICNGLCGSDPTNIRKGKASREKRLLHLFYFLDDVKVCTPHRWAFLVPCTLSLMSFSN